MSLNELRDEIHNNAVVHGWWDEPRAFGEIIALCHSELSEALEEYRNGNKPNYTYTPCLYDGDEESGCTDRDCKTCEFNKPEGIPTELADVIIRILDYCGREGIDIEKALLDKHEYNKGRPYRHGGKKI